MVIALRLVALDQGKATRLLPEGGHGKGGHLRTSGQSHGRRWLCLLWATSPVALGTMSGHISPLSGRHRAACIELPPLVLYKEGGARWSCPSVARPDVYGFLIINSPATGPSHRVWASRLLVQAPSSPGTLMAKTWHHEGCLSEEGLRSVLRR